MKRILSIILLLSIVLFVGACDKKEPDPSVPAATDPTVAPTEPTVAPTEPIPPMPADIRQGFPFSKENVPEFLTLFYKIYPSFARYNPTQERYCYNATPPGVFEETGVQIFAFNPFDFFLLFDNKVYEGDLTNYSTPTSAVTHDCDGDGVKELIFSFHHYAGGHYSSYIRVFNTVSRKYTILYKETNGANPTLYITKSEDDSQAPFAVWRVNHKLNYQEIENDLFPDSILFGIEYEFTEFAGYLKMVNGSLQFVPHTQ